MKCDVEPITGAAKKLESSTNELSSLIAGDWKDEVKESYQKYIFQCKENTEKIQNMESKMKAECEKLSRIDIDAIIDSAEAICFAIDEV